MASTSTAKRPGVSPAQRAAVEKLAALLSDDVQETAVSLLMDGGAGSQCNRLNYIADAAKKLPGAFVLDDFSDGSEGDCTFAVAALIDGFAMFCQISQPSYCDEECDASITDFEMFAKDATLLAARVTAWSEAIADCYKRAFDSVQTQHLRVLNAIRIGSP